ncbi:MAG: peptidoglycan synthetase, partial [Flavobacteriaceae bacterium]
FYDAEALQIKNRAPLAPLLIEKAFQHPALTCITEVDPLHSMLLSRKFSNEVLVMMSSGSFGRIDWEHLKERF